MSVCKNIVIVTPNKFATASGIWFLVGKWHLCDYVTDKSIKFTKYNLFGCKYKMYIQVIKLKLILF